MLKFFYLNTTGWKGKPVQYAAGYERINKEKLLVSFARCSDKDVFVKAKARLICKGRLNAGKCTEVTQEDGKGLYETLILAIKEHEKTVEQAYRKE